MLSIPWLTVGGGMLIGLSALLLMYFSGKTAGISGIFSQALRRPSLASWQWQFLLGMIAASVMFSLLSSGTAIIFAEPLYWYALAGLIVGFGTFIGNGCTSGHGICGVGRFSRRSWIATGVFMLTGMNVATWLGM